MASVRLPVCGATVVLRVPTGADDVFLAEESSRDTATAIALLARVAAHADGTAIDWSALSLTDVDVALLELRRLVIGDLVRTAVRCTSCEKLFDVSFSVADYVKHHWPKKAHDCTAEEHGWFRLGGREASFRLPTAADAVALAFETDPATALATRCIRQASDADQELVESAMEALSPSLYDELDCVCHECGAAVPLVFNPTGYVLGELARRASQVYEDVHLLASAYHWSEHEILALPQMRRARYAERAWTERGR